MYSRMVIAKNLESTTHWVERDNGHNPIAFKRCFFSFDAMKERYAKGCRSLTRVDGAHLKGPYGCALLSAVALDGNNGLFPTAIAVVELETRESWGYFTSFGSFGRSSE